MTRNYVILKPEGIQGYICGFPSQIFSKSYLRIDVRIAFASGAVRAHQRFWTILARFWCKSISRIDCQNRLRITWFKSTLTAPIACDLRTFTYHFLPFSHFGDSAVLSPLCWRGLNGDIVLQGSSSGMILYVAQKLLITIKSSMALTEYSIAQSPHSCWPTMNPRSLAVALWVSLFPSGAYRGPCISRSQLPCLPDHYKCRCQNLDNFITSETASYCWRNIFSALKDKVWDNTTDI